MLVNNYQYNQINTVTAHNKSGALNKTDICDLETQPRQDTPPGLAIKNRKAKVPKKLHCIIDSIITGFTAVQYVYLLLRYDELLLRTNE